MPRAIKYVIGTVIAGLVITVIGGLAFIQSGFYPIAANKPHLRIVRWALTTLQENSVGRSAKGVQVPPLNDPALVRHGFMLYQRECLVCHGAPGVGRPQIGRGINPVPPRLTVEVPEWTDGELYWIIRNGLKMAGMPAFNTGHTETDLWSLVAFVRRLPELSMDDYQAMVAVSEGRLDPAAVEWLLEDDRGFGRLLEDGEPARGEALIDRYGCGTCHVVPGVRSAVGKVGPPLTLWAERHFIAGNLLNTPENLVAWIMDPQAIEPGTAMPAVGVSEDEALDIAAYLYTLGEPPHALHTAIESRRREAQ